LIEAELGALVRAGRLENRDLDVVEEDAIFRPLSEQLKENN
jgi:hypothetical protein